jgi:hypothetical protein
VSIWGRKNEISRGRPRPIITMYRWLECGLRVVEEERGARIIGHEPGRDGTQAGRILLA